MPTVHDSRLGTKLGPRLAMVVVKAVVYAHTQLAVVRHKVAMTIFHAISDEISNEVDVTMGPFLRMLHDNTPEDHVAYPMVHFLHTATGQLKAAAGAGLQISGLAGSLATIINNTLAPQLYNLIALSPGLLPDAGTIAQSFAAGLTPRDEARGDLGALGIQYGWGDKMLTMASSYPTVVDALDFIRRGLASADDFTGWAKLNGIPADLTGKYLGLLNGPVSVADAALAVLRGNISQADGEKIAAENGYDVTAFSIIVNNTGEPPGLQQLLEAYRRGFIDKATLEKGIRDSRYRNEWIPMLEQLRYQPLSVADAVNAVVQNQLDAQTATRYADENGLQPGDLDILIKTAGEPLSRTEMEQLYNRGIVTHDQVVQALRESRLKNKYNEYAFDLHVKLSPIDVLSRAVRFGSVSQASAVAKVMENGYAKDDATMLVESASQEKTQSFKDDVLKSVTAMYQDSLMSEADASSMIRGLGFTEQETSFVLKAATYHRTAQITTHVVNAVRTKFAAHHIDELTASGYLSAVGVASAQRDQLLALWKIQAEAYTRTLTEAQVIKAVAKQLITTDDGTARLLAMGYSATDAALLIGGA